MVAENAVMPQSLLLEDNDAAVTAGVNLMLSAGTTAAICLLQASAPACNVLNSSAQHLASACVLPLSRI